MITEYEKWDYLTAVKLSTRTREITLKRKENFNYFNCLYLFRTEIKLKGALSGLRQFLVTENLLKAMKNAFCFI